MARIHTPFCVQCRNHRYTVWYGGNVRGTSAHAIPPQHIQDRIVDVVFRPRTRPTRRGDRAQERGDDIPFLWGCIGRIGRTGLDRGRYGVCCGVQHGCSPNSQVAPRTITCLPIALSYEMLS